MQENVPLAPLTTFRIGGTARYFVSVKNIEEVSMAVSFAKNKNLPIFVLGGGSNIVVSDNGFSGLVIKNEIKGIFLEEKGEKVLVEAGAGEDWDDFVNSMVEKNLWGLENLSGIPGTVGASPVQNVGAYGVEVKDLLKEVFVFDMESGEEKVFSNEDCQFTYRNSTFKNKENKKYLITKVSFVLNKSGKANLIYGALRNYFSKDKNNISIHDVREAVLNIRKNKLPNWREIGTVGSFFSHPIIKKEEYAKLLLKYEEMPYFAYKNDLVKIPAGWLMEFVGNYKGIRKGQLGVYDKHALVLVNYGGAGEKELDIFVKEIEKNIFDKTGIILTREPEYIF